MTKTQVESILTARGQAIDTWISLENEWAFIGLTEDSNIFILPQSVQFYFSSEYETLFIRNIERKSQKLIGSLPSSSIPVGYIELSHDGKYYQFKIESNGRKVIDSGNNINIGIIHEAIVYDTIAGFYKNSKEDFERNVKNKIGNE